MAKVIDNIIMRRTSGKLGDQLIFRIANGQTIMAAKLGSSENRVYSEAQLAQQQAFREANLYAQAAKGQEIYRIKANGGPLSPFNLAMADWLHAPQIHGVDLSKWNGLMGEPVRVQASDDVKVTHVIIRILDVDGNLQEEGQATDMGARWWEYKTRGNHVGAMTVSVTASDLPGNLTEASKEKVITE